MTVKALIYLALALVFFGILGTITTHKMKADGAVRFNDGLVTGQREGCRRSAQVLVTSCATDVKRAMDEGDPDVDDPQSAFDLCVQLAQQLNASCEKSFQNKDVE